MSASFSALSSPPPPSPTHLPLPGIGAAWHLAQVEVLQPVLQQMYVFPCDDWLQYDSKLGGLDNCKRELISGAAAAAGGLVSYKVSEGRAEDVAGGLALLGGAEGVVKSWAAGGAVERRVGQPSPCNRTAVPLCRSLSRQAMCAVPAPTPTSS